MLISFSTKTPRNLYAVIDDMYYFRSYKTNLQGLM